MNLICIGKIVNTHGIKGEVRILSDFLFKDELFKKNRIFYIGSNKEKQVMKTYRHHKIFDMIMFEGINDINDVLKYKGLPIYVNRDDLDLPDYLNEDLIGLDVYSNRYIGVVTDVVNTKAGRLLEVKKNKKHLIPYNDVFIKNIDIQKKVITIEEIEGLIDED